MGLMKKLRIRSTNVRIKRQYIDEFFDHIKGQFEYGGDKYKPINSDVFPEKESTDFLCDAWGLRWVLGICNKYLFRLDNQWREEDMYKIATYMFLLWLKLYSGEHAEHNRQAAKNARSQVHDDKGDEAYCDHIDCNERAEYEIIPPTDDLSDIVNSCTEHLGDLMTNANTHKIQRIEQE